MKTEIKWAGWRVAIGCALIACLNFGGISTFGVFMPAMSESLGVSVGALSLSATFTTIVSAVTGMTFAPALINKLGAKKILALTSVLFLIHYSGFAVAKTLPVVFIFGSLAGLLVIFGLSGVIGILVSQWFIDKRASIVGIVMAVGMVGISIWTVVAGMLITSFGYRKAYVILGVTLMVLGLLINAVFIREPETMKQKPLGWEKQEELEAAAKAQGASLSGVTLKDALKLPSFYMLFAGLFFASIVTNASIYRTALLVESGVAYTQATQQLGIVFLISAAATLGGGIIAQKFGNRVYICVMTFGLIVGTFFIGFQGALLGGSFVFAMIMLTTLGDNLAGSGPTILTTDTFGNRDFTRISMYMVGATQVGGALSAVIFNGLLSNGFTLFSSFLICALFSVISLALLLLGQAISPVARAAKKVKSAGSTASSK